MKLDFHTHGKLAKKLPFSTQYTDWLFEEAKNAGLNALCLTEHFNTLQFRELYGYLMNKSRREGDTLLLENGLRIFPGMETDIAEGGHVLCLGSPETVLELNRRMEPHKEPGKFLPFGELIKLFREYDVLVGAAHPYRAGSHIPELSKELLCCFDFLDLNGKDVANDRERTERLTRELGDRLHKPVVSGSDTHQAVQYGWRDVLSLMALLTINVGIFNLLPIPALDGCKLLFLLFEGVTGHAVPQRFQIAVNTAGMVLLLWLMLLVTMQDITRIL